jgi:microcystin degradation protein MlrC
VSLRIAVGQISSESSQFVSFPCELELFRKTGFLHEGEGLFALRGTGGEVGGMLDVLENRPDVEVIPLLAARANSSGPLSAEAWDYLRTGLLEALEAAGPVHGVLLSHHGSMAAAGEDDPEGAIAEEARRIVGPEVPIMMTLDLHGNVTRRMVENCTAILGYERYPHHDVFETGQRAARLLLTTLAGEVRPIMAHARLPMLATAFHASTEGDGPFARLMREAKAHEVPSHSQAAQPGILSTSLFFVGSYLDMPDMGSSALVVTDGNPQLAMSLARELAGVLWALRHEFDVESLSVAEAVERGRQIDGGPVLLLDTADTTGGGAAGDSSDLVRDLLAIGVTEPCLAMVVDPAGVERCVAVGVGRVVRLELGHTIDPIWGKPLHVTGKVLRLTDGAFQYAGGILGGTGATMGPSAVVEVGPVRVLIMTYATYDWADEQYRSAGLDPSQAKFVGVKNMMNFRYAYRDTMKGYFVLDLPGPTAPDMRHLPFKRVNRPIFPLDEIDTPEIRTALSSLDR